MFFHKKELITDVKVEEPNARFAQLLLEQFGGATGELSAGLSYWVQSFHVDEPSIRDMLQDIALEEFSHLEVVGRLIEAHTRRTDQTDAYKSTLFAVRGVGPHFLDSQGVAWTAAYLNEGGDVVRDLRADIAAEAGARQTYEALMNLSPDEGSKKALHMLLTREISHTHMFMEALRGLGKLTDPFFGNVPPDSTVNLYFNVSSDGNLRGPWNKSPAFQYIEDPKPGSKESTATPAGPLVKGQTRIPPGGMEWAESTAKPIPPTGSISEPSQHEPRKR
jgi:Mn-containing catalase